MRASAIALFMLIGSNTFAQEAKSAAAPDKKSKTEKPAGAEALKEIAGSAEFLRNVPKKHGTIFQEKMADATKIVIEFDGDAAGKRPVWELTDDAEIKIHGWWGRLEQLKDRERVWAWFTTDRSKKAKKIFMLADEISEKEIHGLAKVNGKDAPGPDQDKLEKLRSQQKAWLRKRWTDEGLPGTVGFLHVYSGETDVLLDHETMRWARSLLPGDKVHVHLGKVVGESQPLIQAVVKAVAAQREKTQVRLVVHSLDAAELRTGQRLFVKMKPPSAEVENAQLPPDIDRPKEKQERIEWFLANIYCTCGVAGDRCTGHFYTLASCNPNACGAPHAARTEIGAMIDRGLTNRQIFEQLLKDRGPAMIRPHLLP